MLQLRILIITQLLITMNVYSQTTNEIQNVLPKIAQMYQAYAKKNHIPGYAFGIMVDGKLVYAKAEGFSNLKNDTKASVQSQFRIASMTKSFTALAILKLRDAGLLHLDDRADQYIPELADQKLTQDSPPITIRNLLTHSAGLPEDNPWGDRKLDMKHDAFIEFLKNKLSLSNAVGDQFEYSNTGYAVLGLIIDKVSGMPYQEYIAKNIWAPLNMHQVAWDYSKVPAQDLVHGYRWLDKKWQEEPMLSDGTFGAMGGMFSSVESFSHYVALYQNAWPARDDSEQEPIHRSSLREMQQAWKFSQLNQNYKLSNGRSCIFVQAYGYGLRWLHDCENKTFVGHSGGLPGFGSNWFILPDYGIGVILLTNSTYANAADINIEVLNTLVHDAKLTPRAVAISKILEARQQALLKLLPDWNEALTKDIFANNFFLDSSLEARRNETKAWFKKAGSILRVDSLVAENQLRGHFILVGQNLDLKVSFTLSPETPALIQQFIIESVQKKKVS